MKQLISILLALTIVGGVVSGCTPADEDTGTTTEGTAGDSEE